MRSDLTVVVAFSSEVVSSQVITKCFKRFLEVPVCTCYLRKRSPADVCSACWLIKEDTFSDVFSFFFRLDHALKCERCLALQTRQLFVDTAHNLSEID